MTEEAIFEFPLRKLGASAVDGQATRRQVLGIHSNFRQLNAMKRPRPAASSASGIIIRHFSAGGR